MDVSHLSDDDAEKLSVQGWFHDPYGLHDARWFSACDATDLVRDGVDEGRDEPPDSAWTGDLVPFEEHEDLVQSGADLLRADDATRVEQAVDPGAAARAALDESGNLGIGFT